MQHASSKHGGDCDGPTPRVYLLLQVIGPHTRRCTASARRQRSPSHLREAAARRWLRGLRRRIGIARLDRRNTQLSQSFRIDETRHDGVDVKVADGAPFTAFRHAIRVTRLRQNLAKIRDDRPTPMMMYKCFLDLGVWPASSVVKVDDTEPGIAEGLAAGCWTVGVTLSGNAVGLSYPELCALSEAERARHRDKATRRLSRCGAHYVIDSVASLPAILDAIDGRLARGEKP